MVRQEETGCREDGRIAGSRFSGRFRAKFPADGALIPRGKNFRRLIGVFIGGTEDHVPIHLLQIAFINGNGIIEDHKIETKDMGTLAAGDLGVQIKSIEPFANGVRYRRAWTRGARGRAALARESILRRRSSGAERAMMRAVLHTRISSAELHETNDQQEAFAERGRARRKAVARILLTCSGKPSPRLARKLARAQKRLRAPQESGNQRQRINKRVVIILSAQRNHADIQRGSLFEQTHRLCLGIEPLRNNGLIILGQQALAHRVFNPCSVVISDHERLACLAWMHPSLKLRERLQEVSIFRERRKAKQRQHLLLAATIGQAGGLEDEGEGIFVRSDLRETSVIGFKIVRSSIGAERRENEGGVFGDAERNRRRCGWRECEQAMKLASSKAIATIFIRMVVPTGELFGITPPPPPASHRSPSSPPHPSTALPPAPQNSK